MDCKKSPWDPLTSIDSCLDEFKIIIAISGAIIRFSLFLHAFLSAPAGME